MLVCVRISLLWGQVPNLGSAANFSVFTGVGAFTNSGSSVIMGDLGTGGGIFLGFPPGQYFGQLHIANATTVQASDDVDQLYSYLSTLSGSSIGVGLGNGQILTPGVYETGAAATLDGNLILDGLNMTDPIFIIKIGGAFSTTSAASVTLINGANSCNVFWRVGGLLTISGVTNFKGTAVVDGAANLEGVATIEGRVLVTNGAINMASNFVSFCELALPVELLNFDATVNKIEKSVTLDWQTASESNSSHFMIQKSVDGISFAPIGKVTAKGNCQVTTQYSFMDAIPQIGKTYYRLQQYDLDGSFSYSPIQSINFDPSVIDVQIFPNPFSSAIHVAFASEVGSEELSFELFSAEGKLVKAAKLTNSTTVLDNLKLQSGYYHYILKKEGSILKSGHLVSY